MSLSGEINDEIRKIYGHWNDLPAIKGLDSRTTEISKQEIRAIIINTMRIGIDDELTKQNNLPRRHAFSAQELLPIINDQVSEPIKIANVYFHIEKLIEIGLIEEVTTIKQGRHKNRYYGRTAKLFLMDFDINDQVDHILQESLINAVKALNPSSSPKGLPDLIQTFLERKIAFQTKTLEWLEKNHDQLKKQNIDFSRLSKTILWNFAFIDPQLKEMSENIIDLIGFDPTFET